MRVKTIATLIVLLGCFGTTLAVIAECKSDGGIVVQLEDSDTNMDGFYVGLSSEAAGTCTNWVQLANNGGVQTATFACAKWKLDTPFDILIREDNTSIDFVFNFASITPYTCDSQTSTANADTNINVSIEPANSGSFLVAADVKIEILNGVAFTLQDPMNFKISFVNSDFEDIYSILVVELYITYAGSSFYFFKEGCRNSQALQMTPAIWQGTQTSVTGTIPAVMVMDLNTDFDTVQAMTIEAVVRLCDINSGSCSYEACPGAKRKRRQVADGVTTSSSSKTSAMVFATDELKQDYMNDMYSRLSAQLGMDKDEEDFCVDKTVSVVILVVLLIGMLLSVLALIWMFVKLRKARKPTLSDNALSEYAYSNKSYSNKESFKK